MRVVSVNIGKSRPNPWDRRVDVTHIDKRPVDGPVAVAAPGPKGTGAVGLAGDRVGDVANHGGNDQAVYAYSREDYGYWRRELGVEPRDGLFAENLTTTGVEVSHAPLGQRWRIGGELLLEVTLPRIPCGTFRGWMEIKGWLKTFTAAARTGAYLKVVTPGAIQAEDPIHIEHTPTHGVTVSQLFRAVQIDHGLRQQLAEVESLPEPARSVIDSLLADA